jgi:SRSO17 transposase
MSIQPEQVPRAGPTPLWDLDVYLHPFAALFRGSRQRPTWASLERYVTGLLTDLPRKNCDTIAAAVAGTTTERLQHLLTDAAWDPLVLDEARVRCLVERSPAGGVLALDDTGLPKQGKASVGVARQYSGTLGKVANCQVVVSAQYVEDAPATSTPVHWPVSARLYLPETWLRNTDAAQARRARARVPNDVTFQTKPALALGLVDRALAWGVPFNHVVADAGYGEVPSFLAGLEARRLPYVVGVPRAFGVRLPDEVQAMATTPPPAYTGKGRPSLPRPAPLWTAETLLACLPDETWETVVWREGTKASLRKQFVAVRVHRATGNPDDGGPGRSTSHPRVTTGPEGWLVGERPAPGEMGERKWYFCWLPDLPVDTPLRRLVTLAHARWPIEQFYEDAKGECGLDDYQGRRYDGLHRHLALVLLTYSFLVTQRLRTHALPPIPSPATAGLSPLDDHPASAAATPPAHFPGHASAGAPLAVRGPAALDRGHRSPAPLAHPPLSPPVPLLTK